MLALHIGNKNYSSWSLRPWVLMTTLGIAFEERPERFVGAQTWAQFRRFSPTGLVPVLVDGTTRVWDTLAITEYLAEAFAGVWPADKAARALARSAAAEMHAGFSNLRHVCGMNCGLRVRLNEVSAELRADLVRLEELWGEGLGRFGGPFLGGERFTAVDAFFAPVAFRVQTYGLRLAPEAMAYVARLLGLPAMRAWYAAALAETSRDPPHEAEVLANGIIVEDLRAPATA